jgi:hypothetical protein
MKATQVLIVGMSQWGEAALEALSSSQGQDLKRVPSWKWIIMGTLI